MIQITERMATALNAAVKVLSKAGVKDSTELVRSVDFDSGGENLVKIDVIFWLAKDDPDSRRIVGVELHRNETGWFPFEAMLWKPWPGMGSVISTWDFNENGNPKKQK